MWTLKSRHFHAASGFFHTFCLLRLTQNCVIGLVFIIHVIKWCKKHRNDVWGVCRPRYKMLEILRWTKHLKPLVKCVNINAVFLCSTTPLRFSSSQIKSSPWGFIHFLWSRLFSVFLTRVLLKAFTWLQSVKAVTCSVNRTTIKNTPELRSNTLTSDWNRINAQKPDIDHQAWSSVGGVTAGLGAEYAAEQLEMVWRGNHGCVVKSPLVSKCWAKNSQEFINSDFFF